MLDKLTFGSLFAGIGGFDLGFERAGLEGRWQVELNPASRAVLRRHFPHAKHYEDITKVGQRDCPLESVDVVCGGSPCQDLSVAGARAGLDGERSGLFRHMVRVCKQLRARYVVWENVPGALSSNEGRDFQAILRALTGLTVAVPEKGWAGAGFVRTPFSAHRWNVAWRVFDSQFFGVPQRRRRIFLVGSLGDASCLEVLFEPESLRGDPPPRRATGQGLAGCLGASAGNGRGHQGDLDSAGAYIPSFDGDDPSLDGRDGAPSPSVDDSISPAVTSKWAKGTGGPSGDECQNLVPVFADEVADPISASEGKTYTHEGKGNFRTHNVVAFSCKDHGADAGDLAPTLRSMNFDRSHLNGGGQAAVLESSETLHDSSTLREPESSDAVAFKPSHFTRGKDGAPGEVLPPLSTDADKGDQEALILPSSGAQVRRLTPRECERLQGFDDDHTAWGIDDAGERVELSDSKRYAMTGNAVTVNVLEWIGRRLHLAALNSRLQP